jgi:hypothetical protein
LVVKFVESLIALPAAITAGWNGYSDTRQKNQETLFFAGYGGIVNGVAEQRQAF